MVAKLDGTNGLLQQYDYQTPSTGFSYTFAAGVNVLVMNPAGTLATGTITMPASPADGMTITFSSTQTITALTVNANTGQSITGQPSSFGAGSASTFVYRLSNTTWYPITAYANSAIPKSSLPTGTVLQVVSATKTDTFSTANTSYTATGLSTAITPSSTSSKILVIISAQIGITANGYGSLQLFRGGSVISGSTGNAAGSRLRSSSGNTVYSNSTLSLHSMTIMYLDTPSSISSLTYELYIRRGAESATLYLNRSGGEGDNENHARGASTITLMEIAA